MRKLVESISGASQIAVNLLLYPLLRGRRRRWGATEDEKALRLPGDELVPDPDWRYDHAISIDAPPSAVWPSGARRASTRTPPLTPGCRTKGVRDRDPTAAQTRAGTAGGATDRPSAGRSTNGSPDISPRRKRAPTGPLRQPHAEAEVKAGLCAPLRSAICECVDRQRETIAKDDA
jgi:hypothetical protein